MRRVVVAGARLGVALIVVASLVFVLTSALPGDSAGTLAGADKGAAAALRAEMGLDRPVPERLLRWWGEVLTGDLGRSCLDRTPVTDTLTERLPATLVVAVPAWLIEIGRAHV